jgi:anti-sigma B factor antagonist
MAEFHTSIEQIGGNSVVRLAGRLDVYAAPSLRKLLLRQVACARQALAVDMADLEYLDTSGLATLMESESELQAKNCTMVLFGVSPGVLEVLSVNGVADIFQVHADRQAAFATLGW